MPAPLQLRRSSLPTRTLTKPNMFSITPVSSILYIFLGRTLGSYRTLLFTLNQYITLLQMFYLCRFQSITFIFLLFSLGLRFLKDRAQFLPKGWMGLPVVVIVVRQRARLKANKDIYLIRTGYPSLDISKRYAIRAFSLSKVRNCQPQAFSYIEGRPRL